jgi:hypothetical protein
VVVSDEETIMEDGDILKCSSNPAGIRTAQIPQVTALLLSLNTLLQAG